MLGRERARAGRARGASTVGEPRTERFPIIALLCSAGGRDALTRVLGPLPADLPAAVLVLRHLSPDHRSELASILDKCTALPVLTATDGARLEPGQVLVTPSGHHTIVGPDHTVALVPSGSLPPYRPSADLLLTSLAITAGDQAIAVVLTGHGNDAATGASVVHRFGGTVLACTAETAFQPAMPQATIDRDDAVDHVVALEHVAELLVALVTAPMLTDTT